jgi:hypothetical protein
MSRYTEGLNPGASLESPGQNPSAERQATDRRQVITRYVAGMVGTAGLNAEGLPDASELAVPENDN